MKQARISYIILGTGGFALELSGLLRESGNLIRGYVGPDINRELPEEWLGDDDYLDQIDKENSLLVAIGNPMLRQRVHNKIKNDGREASGFIHPRSWISSSVTLGGACILYPHATLHQDVELGMAVLVNSNTSIGHETKIGMFTNISPGVSIGGRCNIGDRVHVGIGSSIIEDISITDDVVIGSGATVVEDIKEPGTYVGVPARKISVP